MPANRPSPLPRGWHFPRVLAHRGGGTVAPENTLAGMRAARRHGHLGVEFDVMLAADAVPVLMHDPELGRTVAGRGAVADLSSEALRAMDAGAWLGPAFAGEPVPLFTETVAWLHQAGLWMNIEIKPSPGAHVRTGQVVGAITQALFGSFPDVRQRPLLSSFSASALAAAADHAPDIPRALLLSRPGQDWERRLNEVGAIALHCNHQHLTDRQAAQVKAAGFGLLCYTVNDVSRAKQLRAWGVDAICTDNIVGITPSS